MMNEGKPMSFMGAAKHFFGTKPNQTASQFLQETKSLLDEDKAEIADGLVKQGYNISPMPTGVISVIR